MDTLIPLQPHQSSQHTVKVCCFVKCKGRGNDRIYTTLEQIRGENITVERTSECMNYCGFGPNVAVNGNVLHQMHPDSARTRVLEEIRHPSVKKDGIGMKSLDDLDNFLDHIG